MASVPETVHFPFPLREEAEKRAVKAMKEICEYCYSELFEESEKVEGNKAFIWKRCSNPECNVTFLVVKYLWQINESQFDSMMIVAE